MTPCLLAMAGACRLPEAPTATCLTLTDDLLLAALRDWHRSHDLRAVLLALGRAAGFPVVDATTHGLLPIRLEPDGHGHVRAVCPARSRGGETTCDACGAHIPDPTL